MQILTWIIVPALAIAVALTVCLHYRRKKRETTALKADDQEFLQATPEQVGYTNGDGEYVLFDHSSLIQEYKHRLSYHHARTAALQQDLDRQAAEYDGQLAELKSKLALLQHEIERLQLDMSVKENNQAPVINMRTEVTENPIAQSASS